jgi:hypothetical protein
MFGLYHSPDFNRGSKHQKYLISRLTQQQLVLNSLLCLALAWVIFNLAYVYLAKHGAKAYRVESAFFIYSFFILLKLVAGRVYEGSADTWDFKNKEKKIFVGVALFCWLLIYIPFLNFPFLSDDYVFLMSLKDGHHIMQAGGFFRPGFNLIFFVLLNIFGYTALPFHVLGFSLHLGCSILVYLLSERIFKSSSAAFLASLAFLLSPFQAEAVLWVSGLQELLWVFFLLLAAFFYTRTQDIGKTEIVLASLFTIIALLSKETAVCFILFFLVLDIFMFRFRRGRLLGLTYATFSSILILFGFVRSVILAQPSNFFTFPDRLFIKNFLSQPFKTFLLPWNQSYFGGLTLLKFFLLGAAAILLWISLLKGKASPDFLLGILLVFISVLPVYKMFYVGPDLQGSRYLYFSTFGWSVMLASIFQRYIKVKVVFVLLTAFYLVGFGSILSCNLLVWKKAGQIIRTLPDNVSQESAPDNFHGAYILRNGLNEYKILRSKMKDFKNK